MDHNQPVLVALILINLYSVLLVKKRDMTTLSKGGVLITPQFQHGSVLEIRLAGDPGLIPH